jgi:hypothetical protein
LGQPKIGNTGLFEIGTLKINLQKGSQKFRKSQLFEETSFLQNRNEKFAAKIFIPIFMTD